MKTIKSKQFGCESFNKNELDQIFVEDWGLTLKEAINKGLIKINHDSSDRNFRPKAFWVTEFTAEEKLRDKIEDLVMDCKYESIGYTECINKIMELIKESTEFKTGK